MTLMGQEKRQIQGWLGSFLQKIGGVLAPLVPSVPTPLFPQKHLLPHTILFLKNHFPSTRNKIMWLFSNAGLLGTDTNLMKMEIYK